MSAIPTPGPWRVEGVEVYGANGKHVVWELGNDNPADHALIAAAPDLLAALRFCRAIIGSGSKGSRLRVEPEAIAQAARMRIPEAPLLIDLIRRLVHECRKHNADYHHVTDEALLRDAEAAIGALRAADGCSG